LGAGIDIGQIAQHLLTYMSGAAGGYIAAAAVMIVMLLWGVGILNGRHAMESTLAVALGWSAAYLVNTVIGWT
jgi:hypothetical protein